MKSLWNDSVVSEFGDDLLQLRVYTSRLLGQEEDLVLHGGGNTSVKIMETDIFGKDEQILYVKGSGWDLATIEKAGFAPVRMKQLLKLADLPTLSDSDMVRYQRTSMTNPSAPNPSVEAILHAIIPFVFVDHTHADAVVTMSNTPDGADRIQELYGESMLIIPYVMPGFMLAKEIYSRTKGIDWPGLDGMILLNHGVFTFHDNPRICYEKMIDIVSRAEAYLEEHGALDIVGSSAGATDPVALAILRKQVSDVRRVPVLARLDNSGTASGFSNLNNVREITNRGPLTPDHMIRTKRTPLVLASDPLADLNNYVKAYKDYFARYSAATLVALDPAPRWAVWPGHGTVAFGTSLKDRTIVTDIVRHTIKAIHRAEQLGEWRALTEQELFEMEYWELEQAKLKKTSHSKSMQGRIALVTGAASGIGQACVERLVEEGAVVAAIDINPSKFDRDEVLPIICDVTDSHQLKHALEHIVMHFGGLDMIISNAGTFPESAMIHEMDDDTWQNSLDVNVTSHRKLLQLSLPYLEHGIDSGVLIIGTKNVAAPGPGASAYSVAKAGLAQLARIAAMEFGEKGIRVNTLHPNAVFDTGLWTDDILKQRAGHYEMTVEEYKTNNILGTEISSQDVAALAICMLGPAFAKTTGAQIPIDGGNDRVI